MLQTECINSVYL